MAGCSFKENLKAGDKVWVALIDTYQPGFTVVEADEAAGTVTVKRDNADKPEKVSLIKVTKVLE